MIAIVDLFKIAVCGQNQLILVEAPYFYVENEFDSDDLFQITNNLASEKPLVGTILSYDSQVSALMNHQYDTGHLPPGFDLLSQLPFAKEPVFDLDNIVRKSIARSNQVFLLRASILIEPGDFGIFPGNIIFCDFPEISPKDLRLQLSKKKSGK